MRLTFPNRFCINDFGENWIEKDQKMQTQVVTTYYLVFTLGLLSFYSE